MDEVVTCWKTAVDTLLMPAKLPPEQLKLLDLHLPLPAWLSPIRKGLLEAVNGICTEFATSVKHAQSTLLSPSDFGKPSGWGKGQDDVTRIMCLRPTSKNSVPVCALHDVFRQFIIDATSSLPEDCSTTVDAVKSAQMLCSMMGEHFKDEAARTNQFDTGVESLFERQRWSHKYQFNASSDLRYGEVDCVFLADGSILIILCEDKWEPRQGVSDVYMQPARDYDLAVKVLEQNERHDPRWTSFLAQGSPMFLVSVLGAQLSVLGGFYDGKHVIVEPLQDTYYMLHDSRGIRQDRLAKVLYALAKGRSTLERLNLNEMPPTFPSSTPRIYESVTLYAKSGASTPGKLVFEDRLLTSSQRWLFHATLLTPSRLRSPTPVVVKLIDGSYSEHVHQLLARHHLAPTLYGCAHREGAPTTYVMEYLGSDWETLSQFSEKKPHGRVAAPTAADPIWASLNQLLAILEQQQFVHGDLRMNNIMVQVNQDGKAVIQKGKKKACIKVIDFDWAGNAGQVRYPQSRNKTLTDITWPGTPGGPINPGHDRRLVESWWSKWKH
ncbi:uncharacterized protein LAESUDRAFT_764614 [Laetiporus sulphureus 93-53]|uniref:Aminoglycoside phosphotransferase domain-containing protein n=1 Tax=Laetiporus sulphureus 93-53 TaxID=1314785 RepID=A0A165B7B0_9APHY|nr:uncharacterized protein LAESUDRAFT_764614 [Laetiporus sulphureus 93-53]KZT00409.1 hypothetical protein LAESUDRAFT_764614 [Laetiporus sulphureus 93-53]